MKRFFLALIFLLFLCGQAWAVWNPAGHKKWQDSEIDTQFCKRIGGEMANYQKDDSSWMVIENDFLLSGDTLAYNIKDWIKTSVKPNGLSEVKVTWQGTDYIVTQRMIKLIWLKTDTWAWVDVIDSVVWSTPEIDSNIIHWSNIFPAVDYRVQKTPCSVAHGIFFKPAFLDSAVILYNQRPDSLNIALGNVVEYTLINVDYADSAMGNLDWRKLKQMGEYSFELSRQVVYFPGSDSFPVLPVKQRWVKRNGKLYCIEYVMMRWIKQIHEAYPGVTIWHNDTKKIEGTTNVEDATIRDNATDKNFGGNTPIQVLKYTTPINYNGLIRVKNVASELGENATITACVCSLYCSTKGDCADEAAYRVFKPWVEGNLNNVNPGEGEGCTWEDWSADANEWATAGCGNADDGGSDNSGDGTGADRKATAEDTENINTASIWYAYDISTTLAQGWYDGTINEEGIILICNDADNSYGYFYNTEYTTSAYRPYWVFTYTTDGAVEANRRAKMIKIIGE